MRLYAPLSVHISVCGGMGQGVCGGDHCSVCGGGGVIIVACVGG